MKKIFIALLLGVSYVVNAQGYKVDSEVAAFELIGVDQKLHKLHGEKGAIVVFTCNHCPFSKIYEQRIIDLDNKFRPLGYPVIAISSNDPKVEPEDSFEKMQELSLAKSYPFPYLFDESQQVAKDFGATRTPHVFVVEKKKSKYILRFKGAIDDNAQSADDAKVKFVEDAVNALLKGEKVAQKEVKAIGCTIKWKKSE